MAAPVASSSAMSTGIEQRILIIEGDIKRIDGEIAAVGEKIRTAETNPPAWLAADQRGAYIFQLMDKEKALLADKTALQEKQNLLLRKAERAEQERAAAGSAAVSSGQSNGKQRSLCADCQWAHME
jgi:hypothetical protein